MVATGSVAGLKAAGYGCSKAALVHLVRVAAREAAPHGIRINAIAPGGVTTPMWEHMPFFAEMTARLGSREAAFAELAQLATPLGAMPSRTRSLGRSRSSCPKTPLSSPARF